MIRRFPNGETHLNVGRFMAGHLGGALSAYQLLNEIFHTEYIGVEKQTRGIETSKYPEERTSIETPLVVASERGPGLV